MSTSPTIEMITIPLNEYEEMRDSVSVLARLEAFGVDNWCGYDEAMDPESYP